MKTREDISPQTQFGRWTVIRELPREKGRRRICECVCECGKRKIVRSDSLLSGRSTGCTSCSKIIHGMCGSKVYRAWEDMIQRCHNKYHFLYPDYGGRSQNPILVCDEWREKNGKGFMAFYAHIGDPPDEEGYWSVDRIDNNKGYEPGNVRWATPKEQANNRRKAKRYSARRRNEYVPTQEQWEDAQRTADVLDVLPEHLTPF
jgi:hypothetical protein